MQDLHTWNPAIGCCHPGKRLVETHNPRIDWIKNMLVINNGDSTVHLQGHCSSQMQCSAISATELSSICHLNFVAHLFFFLTEGNSDASMYKEEPGQMPVKYRGITGTNALPLSGTHLQPRPHSPDGHDVSRTPANLH
jgi:hypothetical protein